jgi:hypothetical protein
MKPKAATRLYATRNLAAAQIVASSPAKYPGVMQTWAALVIERAQPTIKGPLFRQAA